MPIAVLVIVALLWPAASLAQAQRPGSIRVTVRDAQNLPIPGAPVVAVEGNSAEHGGTTNERGMVDLEGLPPGSYTLRVESPGFEPLALSGVFVRPASRTTREIELKIASFVDQVDVVLGDADKQLDDAL